MTSSSSTVLEPGAYARRLPIRMRLPLPAGHVSAAALGSAADRRYLR
ncbi:hypothetical protein [Streptomyces himalayensis]|uniref:Uncharacterized protein n=1 Tax=Streptomyces himalayensis subsp. himalayensis TaxID=2756131 RepID=A0A7W0DND5_9ACTN|nr:hypothetical protein [Streptomyces himalayensis]MBA2948278.1 hypothetical protein [Streptomyces himalayensis subsp. himalayensis]